MLDILAIEPSSFDILTSDWSNLRFINKKVALLIGADFLFSLEQTANITTTALGNTSYVCSLPDNSELLTVGAGGSGLDSYVGVNVLQTMIYNPDCSFDSTCIEQYLSELTSTLISASGGILIMLIVVLLFILFSPCLCSRRFRQWSGWKQWREYKYSREFSPSLRRIIVFLGVLVSLGALVDVALIAQEKKEMDEGLNGSLCQVYLFMNQTLNGGGATVFEDSEGYIANAAFPGLTNAGEVVSELAVLVAPESPLVQELNSLMNLTGLVEEQYLLMLGLFTTLNEVMQTNAVYQNHTCVFCSNFSTYPSADYDVNPSHPSLVAINSSLSAVISMLREQLKPFMVDQLRSLHNALTETESTINSAADNLSWIFNSYVISDLDLINSLFNVLDISLIILLVVTFIPIGLCAYTLWKGARGVSSDPPVDPRVASVPMWISLIYTVLVFTLGGVILIGAHILASGCLIMEDMGSVAAKASYRFTDSKEATDRVVAITQECLEVNTDGDILSAIILDGQSTARDKINALTALEGEFYVLNAAIAAGNTSINLSQNVFLDNMGKYLASVGDLYLMNSTTQSLLIETNASFIPNLNYSAIFNTNQNRGFEIFFTTASTAPQCLERNVVAADTPPGVLALLANYSSSNLDDDLTSIPGIDSFIHTLASESVSTGTDTCPANAYPSSNLVPWGNLLQLKLNILYNQSFSCSVPSLTYSPANLSFTLSSSTDTCNSTEYAKYMASYRDRIAAQALVVDTVVAENFDAIFNETWDVLYGQLLQPAQYVGSNLNCQFISIRWNALFDSLCIVFTPTLIRLGKTLLALGFVGVFALIVQIVIWRHLKDNMCLWRDSVSAARDPRRGTTFARLSDDSSDDSFAQRRINSDLSST